MDKVVHCVDNGRNMMRGAHDAPLFRVLTLFSAREGKVSKTLNT